jgi:hypothetical protein
VAGASIPDQSRRGLTDPGLHALSSSLPIMWRRASALAGPSSSVHIAGVRYPIPEVFRRGSHFVAYHGYFTEGFHMVAIRSGSRSLRLLRKPRTFQIGERWVYETSSGELCYEIESMESGQRLRIVSSGEQVETVLAVVKADGLALTRVVLQALREPDDGAAMSFSQPNEFSIQLGSRTDAISGSASAPDVNSLRLSPRSPDWAIPRSVNVKWTLEDDVVTLETTCDEA